MSALTDRSSPPPRETAISVGGIEVTGYHGATEAERRTGCRLRIDVQVIVAAPTRDALDDTLDYRAIERTVLDVNRCSQFNLIESLASAVAGQLLERHPEVERATVAVSKRNPVGMGRGVLPGVTATRTRR
jgi:dihydroneopterin aldolase